MKSTRTMAPEQQRKVNDDCAAGRHYNVQTSEPYTDGLMQERLCQSHNCGKSRQRLRSTTDHPWRPWSGWS